MPCPKWSLPQDDKAFLCQKTEKGQVAVDILAHPMGDLDDSTKGCLWLCQAAEDIFSRAGRGREKVCQRMPESLAQSGFLCSQEDLLPILRMYNAFLIDAFVGHLMQSALFIHNKKGDVSKFVPDLVQNRVFLVCGIPVTT